MPASAGDASVRGVAEALDEVAQIGRSEAAPVEAVEDQYPVAPAEVRQAHLAARGRRQREVGGGLAEPQARHGVAVYPLAHTALRAAGRRGAGAPPSEASLR